MGFLENIARRFSAKPAPRPQNRRDYNAAMLSRLTASWTTTNLSANSDIYRNLDVLRARSRDLAQNNVYAKAVHQDGGRQRRRPRRLHPAGACL